MNCDKNLDTRSGIACEVLEQLAEGLAERKDFAQIVGAEVRAGVFGAGAFAAHLNNANDLVAGKNRSADQFLDKLGAFAANLHPLKNGGMTDAGKIVDDVRTALASRFRSDGGSAGKRDKAHLFERFRHEKMKVAPAGRNAHEGDFVGFYPEILGDAFRDAGQGYLGRGRVVRCNGVGDTFQLRDEAEASSHWISVRHAKSARREEPGGYHPSYVHLSDKARGAQRIFRKRVSEIGTAWLASLFSTAYTERAAILHRPSPTHAAERACPERQPSLKPTIFFASCIP